MQWQSKDTIWRLLQLCGQVTIDTSVQNVDLDLGLRNPNHLVVGFQRLDSDTAIFVPVDPVFTRKMPPEQILCL